MIKDLADIGLTVIKKAIDMWSSNAASDSLIGYTKTSRVEPICLIDTDCLFLEQMPEVMQSLQSIFTGYYLQAVAISCNVGKIDVRKQLDALNPNRDFHGNVASAAGMLMATESYRFKLPVPGDEPALEQMAIEAVAMEAPQQGGRYEDEYYDLAEKKDRREEFKDMRDAAYAGNKERRDQEKHERDGMYADFKDQREEERFAFDRENITATRQMREEEIRRKAEEVQRNYEFNQQKFGHEKAMAEAKLELERAGLQLKMDAAADKPSEFGFGRDTISTMKELTNLSVGKLVTVEITDGVHKAEIPISIRLLASSLPTNTLIHILTAGNKETSARERYHAWRAGRLEFIRDLVLCQDLIDAHRKSLMADKDNVYQNILRRNRGNQISAMATGHPSVATASNLVVISDDTKARIELEINGKLSDFKVRQKIFAQTYVMIMVVIDKRWERVTFYHRGIPQATEVGMRDLKIANKGSGPDVSDILKAYQLGNAPSL